MEIEKCFSSNGTHSTQHSGVEIAVNRINHAIAVITLRFRVERDIKCGSIFVDFRSNCVASRVMQFDIKANERRKPNSKARRIQKRAPREIQNAARDSNFRRILV